MYLSLTPMLVSTCLTVSDISVLPVAEPWFSCSSDEDEDDE